MQHNSKRIFNIACIVTILFVLITIFFTKPLKNSNTVDFKDIKEQGDYFKSVKIYSLDENGKRGVSTLISLPSKIETTKPFFLELDLTQINDIEHKSFSIHSSYMDFICYVDNKVIYAQESSKKGLSYSSGSYSNYVIDFPENIDVPTLTIKFIPTLRYTQDYILNRIYFGYRNNLITPVFTKELKTIVISFLLFLVFVSLIVGTVIFSKSKVPAKVPTKRIINIALLALVFSVYSFMCYDSTNYLFSQHRPFLYLIKYTSLLYTPCIILRLLDDAIEEKFKKISSILINIALLNYALQIFLTIFKIIEFRDIHILTFVVISITISIQMILVIISKNSKFKYMILLTMAPVVLIMGQSFLVYKKLGYVEIINSILFTAIFVIVFHIYFAVGNYMELMKENEKSREYKSLVAFDTLTSLGSRRAFEEHMLDIEKMPRDVTIISADLNNLKQVNDELGHAYGDIAIKEAGLFLKNNIKDAKFYRTGGDEYVVICNKIMKDEEFESIKNKKININNISDKIDVSLSIGMANYYSNNNMKIYDVFALADQRMYDDKKEYKDKIGYSYR